LKAQPKRGAESYWINASFIGASKRHEIYSIRLS
jgi:hypothetical protein